MKKILYCILHGSMNPDRYFNIKETWGQNVDCLFYSDHEDIVKNIVKVSNRKDYHSNEEKHINSLKYVNEHYNNYDWYFFCDDDTYVDVVKLENLLSNLNEDIVYGSVINCWSKDFSLNYCSGGAGYLISKKILNIIGQEIKVLNTGYSDVTLGIYLREQKIMVENIETFKSQSPNFYSINDNEISNYITFHYIKTKDEMNNLYSINNK